MRGRNTMDILLMLQQINSQRLKKQYILQKIGIFTRSFDMIDKLENSRNIHSAMMRGYCIALYART